MHTNSSTTNSQSQTTAQQQQQQQSTPAPSPHSQSSSNQTSPQSQQSASQVDRHAHTNNDFLRHQPPPPTFRPAPEFHPPFFTNGNGLFRPGFPGYQHPAHHHPPVLSHSALNPTSVQNGKLSMYRCHISYLLLVNIKNIAFVCCKFVVCIFRER